VWLNSREKRLRDAAIDHKVDNTEMDVANQSSDAGVSAALRTTLRETVLRSPGGHPVIRDPADLRLHWALTDFGWGGYVNELNDAARANSHPISEPILVSTSGTILSGFGS
jgi:hypothetical protein